MNILITGGMGFIGRYLSKHLQERGHSVYSPGRQDLNLLESKSVENVLKSKHFDFVIHCATRGRYTPYIIHPQVLQDNLAMFTNIWNCRNLYGNLINIGTGAEFGQRPLNTVVEEDLLQQLPVHSYGLSKNIISRIIYTNNTFNNQSKGYNIRLFGCFDVSESNNRLFKLVKNKVSEGKVFTVENDRLFDMIWLGDVLFLIETIINGTSTATQINCVYRSKMLLSDIVKKFVEVLGLDQSLIKIGSTSDMNYTGNSDRYYSSSTEILGMEEGFKQYKQEL